ncbi:MAG: ATP-binding protein [Nonlabens sp.]
MMLLTIISSILIAGVSIYQFSEQARDYHEKRLERKEQSVKESIAYVLRKTDFQVSSEMLPIIFREEIYEVSNLHGMPVYIYDLDGQLLKSSKAQFTSEQERAFISNTIVDQLRDSPYNRFVDKYEQDGLSYRSSYTYLMDNQFKNIGILNVEYVENDDFMRRELEEFLKRLLLVYIVMFAVSILVAYFLSKYITRSIRKITDRMERLHIDRRNEKIDISKSGTEEINTLLNSYNSMVDKLEESAVLLAKSEREHAWREMAKQVAHEIKNPLTPMRLTVQSFQRRFDPEDSESQSKVAEFCSTLVEQIDVMSNIASAFSTYASMPAQKSEVTDVAMVTQLALDIFNEQNISFTTDTASITAIFDRTQLIRVVTNLVKNAIQATAGDDSSRISVNLQHDDDFIYIKVHDNGTGIHPDHLNKIFEPKFTTKTSGMGLGLAMVKQIVENFKGTISVTSQYGEHTEFMVQLPRA